MDSIYVKIIHNYLPIILYLLLTLLVSLFFGKSKTKEDYLIAKRKLKSFQAATTIFSSKVGVGILINYTALVYLYGSGAFWFFIGATLGYFVFYFFAKKVKKQADEKKYYTLADYFFDQKGKMVGNLVSIIVFLTMFAWVIINSIGGAKIITTISPLSFEWSIAIIGFTVLSYLFIGGFRAIIKTDIIQAVGISLLLPLALFLIFSFENFFNTIHLDFLTAPFHQMLSFFLGGVLTPLASAELWQRVYALNNQKDLKKSLTVSSIFYFITGILLLFIGLAIRSSLVNLDPDTALIIGLKNLLPVSLGWLVMIIFYSAVMSSLDTYLFASSLSFNKDFLEKINLGKKYKTHQLIKMTMIVMMLLTICLSFFIESIVATTLSLVALAASLGIIVLATWIFPKINIYSLSFAATFSLVGSLELLVLQSVSVNFPIQIIFLTLLGFVVGKFFDLFFGKRKLKKISEKT